MADLHFVVGPSVSNWGTRAWGLYTYGEDPNTPALPALGASVGGVSLRVDDTAIILPSGLGAASSTGTLGQGVEFSVTSTGSVSTLSSNPSVRLDSTAFLVGQLLTPAVGDSLAAFSSNIFPSGMSAVTAGSSISINSVLTLGGQGLSATINPTNVRLDSTAFVTGYTLQVQQGDVATYVSPTLESLLMSTRTGKPWLMADSGYHSSYSAVSSPTDETWVPVDTAPSETWANTES